MTEEQRFWRNEFGTPPPTCVTVAKLSDKSEEDGTAQDVNKGRSEDLAVQLTMEMA
jgi:hypothetical protein